ncbi:glycosyltransferase [Chryseobacterium sp. T20]|uniref:glycosyltransferase n=1 Tax=Chryseobacterium sp. T20 TaxID=3395375 RepID=UPI0039BC8A0A
MKKNSMVNASVIMSVYNEKIDWVKESIESIIHQTFKDFEFLIVLDKPDNIELKEYIHSICESDNRVIFIINESNIGLTKSLNKAISMSTGQYIIRMDADDISFKDRFEKQIAFMNSNKDILASGGSIEKFGNTSELLKIETDSIKILEKFVIPSPLYPPLPHPTAIIRREVFFEMGVRYNEDFLVTQDYELWNTIIKIGKIGNLEDILLKYRITNNQITSNKKQLQRTNKSKIIRDHIEFFISKNTKRSYKIPSTITITEIKQLKVFQDRSELLFRNQLTNFIICFYLSLDNYSFSSLFYFITHDFFNNRIPNSLKKTIILNHIRKNPKIIQ